MEKVRVLVWNEFLHEKVRPGHEIYPTYYRDDVRQVLINAVEWAKPSMGSKPTFET